MSEVLKEIIFNNRFFWLIFSIGIYEGIAVLFKKYKNPFLNPLLITGLFIIGVLYFFDLPLEYFKKGGDVLDLFLGPATIALLVPLYRQFHLLKKHYIPILTGAIVGAITAIISVYFIGKLLGIDSKIILSVIPKSITSPFGTEASKILGGLPPITIFSIVVTGISGNVMATSIFKLIGNVHPVAKGVGIGCSSHLSGTAKAIELGEVEGAMSATSIVVAGIITIIIVQVMPKLF
ncbi:MAG: LrgB family protein [Fusobacteriaceae bacterium]